MRRFAFLRMIKPKIVIECVSGALRVNRALERLLNEHGFLKRGAFGLLTSSV